MFFLEQCQQEVHQTSHDHLTRLADPYLVRDEATFALVYPVEALDDADELVMARSEWPPLA